MTRTMVAGGAIAAVLVLVFLLAFVAVRRAFEQYVDPPVLPEITPSTAATPEEITPSTAPATAGGDQGFIYGRITTNSGATYEGRLRWGGDQEAFWGDYFNGSKDENPWVAHAPLERLPKKHRQVKILWFEFGDRERPFDFSRPFMARFGDIARIEAGLSNVRVTLKSGTAFDLDRQAATDFDDGVRVWDGKGGVVDLDWISTIELLPTAGLGAVPARLHGTVRTRHGDFTGFVQWDRTECVGADELDGRTAEGELSIRFDLIRSIAFRSRDSSLVTLLDGREIVLSDTSDVGHDNRGIYVDDRRYGRVLILWDAFERIDFSPGGSGPAYGDFPPGRPLTGTVTTRDGRRFAGRLVYDLDESETTETLDAPSQGVYYNLPFGLIASIVPAGREEPGVLGAKVTLQTGEELLLERTGDLGGTSAGMLIFVDGLQRPEYVPWPDVEQIDFDRSPAMYPALAGR